MTGIIRNPSKEELNQQIKPESVGGDSEPIGFQPVGYSRYKSPQDEFNILIKKKEQETLKKRIKIDGVDFIPAFPSAVVKEEFKTKLENWEKEWKRTGFVKSAKPKFPKTAELKEYEDLTIKDKGQKVGNFVFISEGERMDDMASKKFHTPIYQKWRKYRYKDYRFTYTFMEDQFSAAERAKKEAKI